MDQWKLTAIISIFLLLGILFGYGMVYEYNYRTQCQEVTVAAQQLYQSNQISNGLIQGCANQEFVSCANKLLNQTR